MTVKRLLITAGPTQEPLDAVRYLGNRSSGQMGAALATAGLTKNLAVTVILGPCPAKMPEGARVVPVQTAADMLAAVTAEWPSHDLLIMAAAVADFRPLTTHTGKMNRENGPITLQLEPTADIVAFASAMRRPDSGQKIVGFSLQQAGDIESARRKLHRKKLDLVVFNPLPTMGSPDIEAVLLWPDDQTHAPLTLPYRSKADFADLLLTEALRL